MCNDISNDIPIDVDFNYVNRSNIPLKCPEYHQMWPENSRKFKIIFGTKF